MQKARLQGFTLIELSIVLVIIGLVVGGMLVGQALIRSAQLQSVMTDVTKYTEAVHQFQQKYNALPGDMANATTYWGANSTGSLPCGSMYSPSTSATSTCNGDGSGTINGGYGTSGVSVRDEEFFAWKHLANAGMIEGKFTGQDTGADGLTAIGVNVPASRVPAGGYIIVTNLDLWGPGGGGWLYPWSKVTHVFVFGGNYNGNDTQLGAVITAAEAFSIDSKSDDGKPGTGKVKTPRAGNGAGWGTENCASNSDPNLATYNTTLSGNICSLIFDIE